MYEMSKTEWEDLNKDFEYLKFKHEGAHNIAMKFKSSLKKFIFSCETISMYVSAGGDFTINKETFEDFEWSISNLGEELVCIEIILNQKHLETLNPTLTINWASEMKNLDKKLSSQYNIYIDDKKNMTASLTGEKDKIISFLTSADYGMSLNKIKEEFKEELFDI